VVILLAKTRRQFWK